MNFRINAGIPTLSGSMLVLLSLLLFIVAYRISKQKDTAKSKLFISLLGVTALTVGAGGVKLISEVDAGVDAVVPLDSSGSITLASGFNLFVNNDFPEGITIIDIVSDGPPTPSFCGVPPAAPEVAARHDGPGPHVCEAGLVLTQGEECAIQCFPAILLNRSSLLYNI